MFRLVLIAALLYGAWTGIDGLLVNVSAMGGPDEVAIADIEANTADVGRWVRVTGGTAHPSVARVSEGSSTTAYLVAFISPERYWTTYDERGDLLPDDERLGDGGAAVVARLKPGYDIDAIVAEDTYLVQGVTTLGVDSDIRSYFSERNVPLANHAILVELDRAPRPVLANLGIVAGTALGLLLIVGSFFAGKEEEAA
ncbi:MAG: hypothetical protein D6701_02050 [Gemmatimonadetes bacterium]|nr:MAG: hypothetical protein D6701_02050 [Gemmatimonadota bacterium]